jgi:hypothetical protein
LNVATTGKLIGERGVRVFARKQIKEFGMNKKLSVNDRDRLLDILNYWHKIEFFIPFDLDAHIAECAEWQIHWLHSDALADENLSLWKPNIPDTHILNSYSVPRNL